jgi:hypothetical protein
MEFLHLTLKIHISEMQKNFVLISQECSDEYFSLKKKFESFCKCILGGDRF